MDSTVWLQQLVGWEVKTRKDQEETNTSIEDMKHIDLQLLTLSSEGFSDD